MKTTVSSVEPVPTASQIAWQDMEVNAFTHFGPNTFTDKEWGGGDEDPNLFNPSNLDCNQWVRTLKAAGFKGVIITAKHHDGFCLWPSKMSTHTVAQSKWKDGKGDVLKELSVACHKYGIKMGVYLSPWDRNHPAYGTPEYNHVFASMLKEVLTHYGPIYEVWFDGANGEGPSGKKQVYDWNLFNSTVHKYQPNAVIFSDGGPGVRWVGNEEGVGGETSWSMIPAGKFHPGGSNYADLTAGSETGDLWVPPECDVSIRPGWFYHPQEDEKNKSPQDLMALYEKSVGRNSLLLLNVPPDRTGRFNQGEIDSLVGMHKLMGQVYGHSLAEGATFTASSSAAGHSAKCLASTGHGFWASLATDTSPWVEADLPSAVEVNRVALGEYTPLGQKVKSFTVSLKVDGVWKQVAEGTTIGRKRILVIPSTTTTGARVAITGSRDSQPTLDFVTLHHAP